MSIKFNIAMIFSVVVLCLSTFTLFQLVLFLSTHNQLQVQRYFLFSNIGRQYGVDSLLCKSAVDICLVSIFGLQHCLQNHRRVKTFLLRHGLDVFERLLYNFGSCLALMLMMYLWQPIPSWVVWEISTTLHTAVWWIFVAVHALSWLFIYSGCYIMDINELLGVKQVFHSMQKLPEPMSLKSEGLKRFYAHMRHPSFSAMTVILFVHPVMQIDRLFLSYGYVLYMVSRTKVDDIDYAYQKRLLQRKERDLNSNE